MFIFSVSESISLSIFLLKIQVFTGWVPDTLLWFQLPCLAPQWYSTVRNTFCVFTAALGNSWDSKLPSPSRNGKVVKRCNLNIKNRLSACVHFPLWMAANSYVARDKSNVPPTPFVMCYVLTLLIYMETYWNYGRLDNWQCHLSPILCNTCCCNNAVRFINK